MPLTTVEYQEFMKTVHQIRDVYQEMDKELKRVGLEVNKLENYEQGVAELKQQQITLEASLQRFEADMQRPPVATGETKEKEEAKQKKSAFFKAMRYGHDRLSPEEKALVPKAGTVEAPPVEFKDAFMPSALVAAEDTAGGLFAPPEFVADIIKGYVAYSPVRDYARIRNTSNRSIQQPRRTGTISATWVGEKTTRTVLTGYSLGRIEIPTQEMYALVLISEQDLEDVNFDLEQEMRQEFSEQFGVAEGRAYVSGNATLQPQGFLTHPDVPVLIGAGGSAGTVSPDWMIKTMYDLPDIYASQARWFMRRSAIGAIRQLRYGTTDQRYIWEPGLSLVAPNTILGVPYTELPDLPAIATGAKSIVFGDMSKAYTIVQRVGMTFKRLAERWVEDSLIGIYARMRVGGQVVLPEALRIYQIQ